MRHQRQLCKLCDCIPSHVGAMLTVLRHRARGSHLLLKRKKKSGASAGTLTCAAFMTLRNTRTSRPQLLFAPLSAAFSFGVVTVTLAENWQS